jgi:hypothetical protein
VPTATRLNADIPAETKVAGSGCAVSMNFEVMGDWTVFVFPKPAVVLSAEIPM